MLSVHARLATIVLWTCAVGVISRFLCVIETEKQRYPHVAILESGDTSLARLINCSVMISEAKLWLEDEYNFDVMKKAFDVTSRYFIDQNNMVSIFSFISKLSFVGRFARLKSIKCAVAGRLLFTRFVATTGDAMGMNMLSKGTENTLK